MPHPGEEPQGDNLFLRPLGPLPRFVLPMGLITIAVPMQIAFGNIDGFRYSALAACVIGAIVGYISRNPQADSELKKVLSSPGSVLIARIVTAMSWSAMYILYASPFILAAILLPNSAFQTLSLGIITGFCYADARLIVACLVPHFARY